MNRIGVWVTARKALTHSSRDCVGFADQVREFLSAHAEQAFTSTELAEKMGVPVKKARQTLIALHRHQAIRRPGRGLYQSRLSLNQVSIP